MYCEFIWSFKLTFAVSGLTKTIYLKQQQQQKPGEMSTESL